MPWYLAEKFGRQVAVHLHNASDHGSETVLRVLIERTVNWAFDEMRKKPEGAILGKPVAELNLDMRTISMLEDHFEVIYVGQLVEVYRWQLAEHPNVGAKTMAAIEGELKRLGLGLLEEVPQADESLG